MNWGKLAIVSKECCTGLKLVVTIRPKCCNLAERGKFYDYGDPKFGMVRPGRRGHAGSSRCLLYRQVEDERRQERFRRYNHNLRASAVRDADDRGRSDLDRKS